MSLIKVLGKSAGPRLAEGEAEGTTAHLWFKTEPVDRDFCYRAYQLQLETISSDQGHDELHDTGCWSWFELAIYENSESEQPVVKNERPLTWRSHGNRMDPLDTRASDSLHYGMIFDRRQDIFDYIEVGNVIGIRVCARHTGWINDAQSGRLLARYLDYDLFTPMSWNISECLEESSSSSPEGVTDGVYTLTPATECHLISKSDEQKDAIWFTTPALDESTISKLQDIQLFTVARHQGKPRDQETGLWSWFDIVILETPESTIPKTLNQRALVWRSHNVPIGHHDEAEQIGKLFDLQHEIFSHLQPGNVVGVRPCTRFVGWELHARSARLVVRIANNGHRNAPAKPVVDWAKVVKSNAELQKALEEYLREATGKPAAGTSGADSEAASISVETTLLTQELRSDWAYGQGGRPLRLLSLDGGGVRGISSLHILKDIMGKVAGDREAKPCDYFDMMAGTSTGGLMAIMLGRLRMTIDECIKAYNELAKDIFSAGVLEKVDNASDTGARYSGQALEEAIKKVAARYSPTKNPDEPMKDPQNGCKVFVLACRADDLSNSVATHMRTYVNGNVEKSYADYKIWEAGRATSAAPTYFPRIKLGDHEYIDGGVGFNNPVLLLMGEARLYFGFARPIGCLVTIGTGMNPNVVLPGVSSNAIGNIGSTAGTLKSMWELVTTTEHANIMAKALVEPDLYFRFNLGKKLAEKRWIETVSPTLWEKLVEGKKDQLIERYTPEDWVQVAIALDNYKEMDSLVAMTLEYMKLAEESERAKKAAAKLPPNVVH